MRTVATGELRAENTRTGREVRFVKPRDRQSNRMIFSSRDSVIATISRSLRDKLTSNQPAIVQENENLEEDMRKAQESTLMLKSVIIPLEEEIKQLKSELLEANEKIQELEALVRRLISSLGSSFNQRGQTRILSVGYLLFFSREK